MSVEYRLVPTGIHPAPYFPITLSPVAGVGRADTIGLFDTGADRSVIPYSLAAELDLFQMDTVCFEGLDGFQVELPIFQLMLAIGSFPGEFIEAAASEQEEMTLIGRDIMKTFRITLDGPAGVVRLEQE